MEHQKTTNLLGNISDKVPNFIIKKLIKVYDQSGNAINSYKPGKQIRFKTSMSQSDSYNYSAAYIFVKGTISVTDPNNNAYDKKKLLKTMHHLLAA